MVSYQEEMEHGLGGEEGEVLDGLHPAYYILWIYRLLFWNVSVLDPRHNSDHYFFFECLHSTPQREHSEYLRRSKWIPLRTVTTPTREDGLFASLQRAVLKPKAIEARKKLWTSETMWRIVNERVSVHSDPVRDQTLIWRLGRAINTSLKGYQRVSTEEAGKEVKRLIELNLPLHWEAWHWMKGWYWSADDRAPPPAWVTLKRITAERVDHYRYIPPPG